MNTPGRARTGVALTFALLAGACGGSGEPEWCQPAGEGFVELVAVIETFVAIATDAAVAGLGSEEEFAAFMGDRVDPAVDQLESASVKMAEAAEQAGDDDVARELSDLSVGLESAAAELREDPAAALASTELNSVLSSASIQLKERCGETLADLSAIPDEAS